MCIRDRCSTALIMQIAKSSSGTRTTIIGMVRSTRENSDWKNSMAITNPTTMSVYRAVRSRLNGIQTLSLIHISGGSLSAADVLTYLYFKEMRVDPTRPADEDRDRFVLSKGHCLSLIHISPCALPGDAVLPGFTSPRQFPQCCPPSRRSIPAYHHIQI